MSLHSGHMSFVAIALALLLALGSCGSASNGKDDDVKTRPFPMPKVPSMIGEADRMQYVAEHFWDDFTSVDKRFPDKDSTIVNGVAKAELEQAAANYSVLLGNLELDPACKAVERLADRLIKNEDADTSATVFETVSEIVGRYLYDPNSPLRDEDLYAPFAAKMADCAYFPQSKREAYADEARRCGLNRRGTKAADFSFSDRNGRVYSLYGIKADHIILFFSNPGCTACKEIIETLNSSTAVSDMIASGKMAVLNIYIDEQLDEWYKYMPIYPDTWYNGYDHNGIIRAEELYDVRAIPSLYLLDKDKTVLLKDAPLERLMQSLSTLP